MGKKENPKIYVCSECGYAFPSQLSHMIENNIRVFCEQCGTPFSLEGRKFKEKSLQYKVREKSGKAFHEKDEGLLEKAIQFLNKLSFIPLIIYSIVIILTIFDDVTYNPAYWIQITVTQLIIGITAFLIFLYDTQYIYPRVKDKVYTGIIADALVMGILGCIIYGTGSILVLKGFFIFIKVIKDPEVRQRGFYDFGVKLKNSFNNISAKAGIIIILLGWYEIASYRIVELQYETVLINTFHYFILNLVFTAISTVVLIIDWSTLKKIKKKQEFTISDAFIVFFLGLLGCIFSVAGLIIIFKAIVIFALTLGTPPPEITEPIKVRQSITSQIVSAQYQEPVREVREERNTSGIVPEFVKVPEGESLEEADKKIPTSIITESIKKIENARATKLESAKEREKILEYQLRLHESLLPVKDEKDRDLVKKYFSKIFTVVSKDIRKRINELNISRREKKELLNELVLLTTEKQIDYLDAISNLYKEIPTKFIARIRKLPNLQPQYYEQIIEQLKYMNEEEQINFIKYLEQNA